MKKEIDMVHGPLGSKILLYALPLAATGILQQLFNAADVAVIGRFVGKEAMAAVGANTAIVGLIISLFVGVSLGSNVVIANAIGRKDFDVVHKAVHTSVLLALLCGIVMTIIGEVFSVAILQSQNVPNDVLPMAVDYLRMYLVGMPVILLYNFEAAIFRGAGNTRTPLIALMISGVVNVLLNIFFVAVLHMEANGVALATVLSNLISSMILFSQLMKTKGEIHLEVRKIRIDRTVLIPILRIGVPSGIQGAVFSFANIIIQSAINSLGATVMAASSAAYNLEIIAYYVFNAFAQACTTFTGQNYGAGKLDRCKRTLVLCLLQGFSATAAIMFLILLFGRNLLGFFNGDPDVVAYGYLRLKMIFGAYFFSTLYDILSGYLRGYGISLLPAAISVLGICATRLLWIFLVFPHSRTFVTILTAYPISLSITAISFLIAVLVIRPSRGKIRIS